MRPDEQRALLRSLGILPEEEGVAEDDTASAAAGAEVDFDGGPREPAPSTEPVEDHNAVVAQLLKRPAGRDGERDRLTPRARRLRARR
jgi:hypothetical protein